MILLRPRSAVLGTSRRRTWECHPCSCGPGASSRVTIVSMRLVHKCTQPERLTLPLRSKKNKAEAITMQQGELFDKTGSRIGN